ncbi:hypothetical protein BDC45DRAFT_554836 [Circinella umbellata]|nr:hypothetical protein BDC45DRAFT_554836 [Circinella umbellata]
MSLSFLYFPAVGIHCLTLNFSLFFFGYHVASKDYMMILLAKKKKVRETCMFMAFGWRGWEKGAIFQMETECLCPVSNKVAPDPFVIGSDNVKTQAQQLLVPIISFLKNELRKRGV